jgi:type IV pilus assembly protein PilY1
MMLTFPPPLIIPRSTPGGDDAILQASFNISVGHQWQGHLKKYKLKKDGSIGDLQWDAGKLLNDNKQASSRNIFTVGDGLTVFGDNNFKESNVEKLKPLLYGDGHANIDNEDAKKLINFVRGVDVFDEFEGKTERWKLGDIYHAELAVMGAPTAKITDNPDKKHTDAYYRFSKKYDAFSKSLKNRAKVVFAGANDGMLHAFRLDTGKELWAFIPPMLNAKLKDMVSSETNKSMSIFGVDGTPVVKDVFVDGRWKTIVMGGLGMGGHGYYALDVTDPDSPEHLFSFAYDPDTKQVNNWSGRNGAKLPATALLNNLGEGWSKPHILRIPIGGISRWVAVIGGGFNGGNIREYGSVVYVLDLENSGRVIRKIDVTDLSGNKIFNSVPTSLTAITPDSSDKANYTGAMVYFADLESKLWKLNLTDQGALYSMKQVFDVEADNLNGRLSYHSVTPTMGSDNKLRMFYGTGDQQKLMSGSLQIDNRFLGLKEQKFPSEDASPTFKENSLLDTTGDISLCSDENDQGWKIKLKPGEKVTSKAMVSYGTVFFSRYEPLTTDQCALGKTSITGVDYQCGSEKFTVDLGTGISTVPTLYRGKLYIGISGDAINTFTTPEGWIKKDNLLMGKPGDLSHWKGVKVKSWRERGFN